MASSSLQRAPAHDIAPAPSQVTARLERARAVVEERFLAAGGVLGLAIDGVRQLIGALDQLGAALDPQTVEATRRELASAAESLLGLRRRLDQRLDRTRGLSRAVDGLLSGVEDMRRHLAYLRVFALNIKVASAGVPDAGEGFAVFAQEISERIEAGRAELEAFALDAVTLHDRLAATLGQEQAVARQCERLIPAVPQALERCAHELAGHHEKVGRAAGEAAGLARAIQGKVASALAALQVGDSTRQRIEHVQHGLALIAAAGPAPPAGVAGMAGAVLSAQLAAAAADFNSDSDEIRRSLAGMAGDARELLRLRDLAFGRSAAAGEGFLDRMIPQLADAADLVGRMAAADADALETGRAAIAAVDALGRRIALLAAIKTDVQQMALNTTLKCARMGDPGKPLSVIAIELRSQSALLERSAQDALVVLDQLAAEAGDLIEDETAAAAGEALSVATERLRKANTGVEADLAALVRQGEAVVAALGDAARRLDFHGEIGAVLESAAQTLDAAPLAPVDPAGQAALAEILQKLAASYTMAREREVHAALAANVSPPAAAPAVMAAPAADDLEAVLF